jgi:hypothetical protein
MAALGKSLVVIGIVTAAAGFYLWGGEGVPLINRFGRLPGDIFIQRQGFRFYFPLTTSIVVSAILSILLLVVRR